MKIDQYAREIKKNVYINIQNKYKAHKLESFKSLVLYRLGILVILFLVIFLCVYSYCSVLARKQVYAHIKLTMELYSDNSTQNLKNVTTYLIENNYLNSDITSLNATEEKNRLYSHAIRIKKLLSYTLDSYSQIDGIFFYSPKKDIFIYQSDNNRAYQERNVKCADYISDILRKNNYNHSFDELEVTNWHIVKIDGTYYIIRYININNSYSGAWVNVDLFFSSFDYFTDLGASILYIDENGHTLNDVRFSDYTFDPKKFLQSSSVIIGEKGKKYLGISQELGYCDYYIMALIPMSNIFNLLYPLYTMLTITIIIFVLFTISMTLIANRLLNTPHKLLKPVIISMRNGDFDTKITGISRFKEVQDIVNTFNDMIGEIHHLRINIYEEKILKKDIELQYLKSQVSPHFLINCLNTIFALSGNPANQDLMYRIIKTLSDHLRYTLSNKTTISLKEEIYFVENYINLMKFRFPDCITYQFEIPSELEDVSVFPFILLMLTENSINSNLVMGETFTIWIKAWSYDNNERKRVHLQHIDSGSGFNEHNLNIYNNITKHPELRKNGHKIGIYNTIMRLRLVFGEDAGIVFSNEPGYGAKIDIDLPYIVALPD